MGEVEGVLLRPEVQEELQGEQEQGQEVQGERGEPLGLGGELGEPLEEQGEGQVPPGRRAVGVRSGRIVVGGLGRCRYTGVGGLGCHCIVAGGLGYHYTEGLGRIAVGGLGGGLGGQS